jgi:hypothetical protein
MPHRTPPTFRRLPSHLASTTIPLPSQGGVAGAPPSQWVASGGATGAFPPDPRVTLLFDLNGVLLVNPRAPGGGPRVPVLRPHAGPALARLAAAFRLGVYSSATTPTVNKALAPVTAAVRLALLQQGDGAGRDAGDGGGGAPDLGVHHQPGQHPAAAKPPPRIFELVLCRKYCRPAPAVRELGGCAGKLVARMAGAGRGDACGLVRGE